MRVVGCVEMIEKSTKGDEGRPTSWEELRDWGGGFFSGIATRRSIRRKDTKGVLLFMLLFSCFRWLGSRRELFSVEWIVRQAREDTSRLGGGGGFDWVVVGLDWTGRVLGVLVCLVVFGLCRGRGR